MKQFLSYRMIVLVSIVQVSCTTQSSKDVRFLEQSNSADGVKQKEVTRDTSDNNLLSDIKNPNSIFLRTADLRFKVSDVSNAIQLIENNTRASGGYVNYSILRNTLLDSATTDMNDSVMVGRRYKREAFMTLRVPDYLLDSMLNSLNTQIRFLDERETHCDDVSLQLLANQWDAYRTNRSGNRIENAISQNKRKLVDVVSAEQSAEAKRRLSDLSKIGNLRINDQIHYSKIQLNVYQDDIVQYQTMPDKNLLKNYQPTFLIEITESFNRGWQLVKDLILFLVNLWSLMAIGLIVFFIIRKFALPEKKVKPNL